MKFAFYEGSPKGKQAWVIYTVSLITSYKSGLIIQPAL